MFSDKIYSHNQTWVQETLIKPAIKGTVNVLNSCTKASSVKRVVLTSTCSAIRYHTNASEISPLNESHWSDTEYCKRHNVCSPTSIFPSLLCSSTQIDRYNICMAVVVCLCQNTSWKGGVATSQGREHWSRCCESIICCRAADHTTTHKHSPNDPLHCERFYLLMTLI